MTEILKQIGMFKSLKEDALQQLASISKLKAYKKGATLFLKGDISSYLMILTEGIVSIFKHDKKGNEIIIGYFHRYTLLAEAATLRKTPLPSSATFQSDGSILMIELEAFETLFMSHPAISYAIIHSLLEKVELLQQNIHFNLASTAAEKILFFYQQNPTLALDLKHYEIASILSITPETFSRNIRILVQKGKLVKVKHGYKITEK